jgi:hypothetical protein
MKPRPAPPNGAALVTTMIVVAVLAVIAVAFMQSMSVDRLSSATGRNYLKARLAAEAGLAEAMSLIGRNAAGFNYVTGTEMQGGRRRTYIRPRTAEEGVWQFDGPPVYLDSGTEGEMASLLVAGKDSASGMVVQASYKAATADGSPTNRYAFWVDEAGSKQNLSWWGGTNAPRGLLSDVADLALLLPSSDGTAVAPVPAGALAALDAGRSYSFRTNNVFGQITGLRSVSNSLVSPATFNLADPALDARVNSHFFTLSSPSSAVSPAGRRKLNLQQLAEYLNSGLSTAQGAGQPRAELVEQLLESDPPQATNWGGGDLHWLAAAGRYAETEQKQIVANLLDYLDDDLIPTTDSVDAPTYFGVEMKADSSGRVMGHPFINFVTAGLVFNRQTGTGLVNSGRILCSLGLAYPWSSAGVATAAYTPEINIAVEGTVENGISGLGSGAGAYFWREDLNEGLSGRPLTVFVPQSGDNWPETTGLAGNASYRTPFHGFTSGSWPARGPANMTLRNARYVINKLRLRYTPTGGGAGGYVQIFPTNQTIGIRPTNLVLGGPGPISLLVKFSSGGPYADTPNLYLNNDPRSAFLPASWTNLPSVTSFGTAIPAPAAGPSALNLTNGVGDGWDKAQGLVADFNWYTTAAVTNHFNRFAAAAAPTIGEIGYLWTGLPWQTLNLTRTNATEATADYHLLDYLSGGFTNGPSAYATMPLLAPTAAGGAITESNSLTQDGGFNVLSRKFATISAYLTNAPGLSASAASTLAAAPPPERASLGGALAALTNLSAANSTKFAREAPVRALANGAVMQSRVFTVYARGEHRSGTTWNHALLEAEVFVDAHPETGAPRLRLLSKRFY